MEENKLSLESMMEGEDAAGSQELEQLVTLIDLARRVSKLVPRHLSYDTQRNAKIIFCLMP